MDPSPHEGARCILALPVGFRHWLATSPRVPALEATGRRPFVHRLRPMAGGRQVLTGRRQERTSLPFAPVALRSKLH